MHHYTYKIYDTKTGEYYIGVRSCKCLPEDDPYMGSMVTWKPNSPNLAKQIYMEFPTRAEAEEWESCAIEGVIIDHLNRNFSVPNRFGWNGLKNGFSNNQEEFNEFLYWR